MDKPTAWACTLTNAVTVPGLGTLAAGRKVGYFQAALATLGMGMTLLWPVLYVRAWLAAGEVPEGLGPHFWILPVGVGTFGVAWLWALGSSLSLHRAARAAAQSKAGATPTRPEA